MRRVWIRAALAGGAGLGSLAVCFGAFMASFSFLLRRLAISGEGWRHPWASRSC